MHHFESWGDSWHIFFQGMCLFMFLFMIVCFILIYRRRRYIFSGRRFNRDWNMNWNCGGNRDWNRYMNWFGDCCDFREEKSVIDILRNSSEKGEITKEEFERIRKIISERKSN